MAGRYTTVEGAMVGVLMGSASDWPTMKSASEMLTRLGIAHECNAISAHRAPERLSDYVASAEKRGVKVLICAAGGAAHLGGVVAAQTHLPVLGCPMPGWALDGMDALLSMVQMPRGVPVATLAVGKAGAVNAALFAAAILGLGDDGIRRKVIEFRREQSERVDELPGD
ncbi:MAG: 5-(carboxyamino)imidazole ribonucleotide mutase [Planctomycetota bacterium]|jgi:5-(carboxyamino)imidazole ribonucleotide mutase